MRRPAVCGAIKAERPAVFNTSQRALSRVEVGVRQPRAERHQRSYFIKVKGYPLMPELVNLWLLHNYC